MSSKSSKPSLEFLADKILDYNHDLFVDNLLDLWESMVQDASFKTIKNTPYFDSFYNKYSSVFELIRKSRLNSDDFTTLKVIGRGAFGEIHLVRSKFDKQVYAMKQLNKYNMIKKSDTAFFWEERSVMLKSNSEWIIKLHYAFQDRKNLYMILDYMAGGDLVNLISNYDITEKWAQFYIAEIVLAINALHKMGYLHRDIKPDNILLDCRGHVKLADFGTCIKMDSNGKVKTDVAVGTPDYISPEVLKCQGVLTMCGPECDYWSVGVLLYELLSGETPFYADSLAVTYGKIMDYKNSLKFPDEPVFSQESKSLISGFLSDANSRLGSHGIEAIKNHKFFVQDQWTWDTIREVVAPVVPDLKGEEDASNFDDFNENDSNSLLNSNFQPSKTFMGNNLPFVGFSFSGHYEPTILNGNSKKIDRNISNDNNLVDKLQTTIKELEASISDFKNQYMKLETQHSRCVSIQKQLEEELNMKIEYNQVLSGQNASYNLQVEEMNLKQMELIQLYENSESTKNSLQTKIHDYEQNLNLINSEELINLKSQLSLVNSKLSSSTQDSEHYKNNFEQLLVKENELTQKISNLEALIEQIKQTNFSLSREKISLQNDLHETTISLDKYKEELVQTTQKADGFNIQIKNLFLENDYLKNKVEAFIAETNYLKDELTNVNRQKIDIELAYSELKSKQKSSSSYDVLDGESEISIKYKEISTNYDIIKNKCNNLESELANYSKKNEVLSNSLNQEVNRTSQIQKELSESNNIVSSLRVVDRSRIKDIKDLNEQKVLLEEQLNNYKTTFLQNQTTIKEFNDKLLTEQYFAKLYQKQSNELKGEIEEYINKLTSYEREFVNFKNEKIKFEEALKKMESENMMITNKLITVQNELNKEKSDKALLEIQIKDFSNMNQFDNSTKDKLITDLANQVDSLNSNYQLLFINEQNLQKELDKQISLKLHVEDSLKKQLETEKTMKNQAVLKLAEIMQRKLPTTDKKQTNIKENKENRRLQFQLKQEKEKFDQAINSYNAQIHDLSVQLIEANQQIHKLQVECTTKDETILTMESTRSYNGSIKSAEDSLEGWLSILSKPFNRKTPWIRHYFKCVDIPNKRILIFESEAQKDNHKPSKSINISDIYHVRSVTQGDIIRANASDIPKIFQILYADDKPEVTDNRTISENDSTADVFTILNGHKFVNIQFHTPTNCDVCNKSLWNFFRPPAALECQKCKSKIHKDHISKLDDQLSTCKVAINDQLAKDLLVLTSSSEEQSKWIAYIQKLITGNLPRSSSTLKLIRSKTNERTSKDTSPLSRSSSKISKNDFNSCILETNYELNETNHIQ